jgi:hypothetical protein
LHEKFLEVNVQLVEETMLDGTNDVCESSNVLWVVLNTVGKQKRNLLSLNTLMSKEVTLSSLDRVGKALLENELVIITNLNADHQTAVSWETLELTQFDELSQEIVFWISTLIGNNIFNHDDGVVGISFLESW